MSPTSKPHKQVSIIAPIDDDGKILLQERIPKYGEEWGFFGGGIQAGETKEEALVREIKEELNHDLEDYEYLGAFESSVIAGTVSKRHLFITKLWDEPENLDVREGKGARLFTLEEARKLKLMPGDEQGLSMIERIMRKKSCITS